MFTLSQTVSLVVAASIIQWVAWRWRTEQNTARLFAALVRLESLELTLSEMERGMMQDEFARVPPSPKSIAPTAPGFTALEGPKSICECGHARSSHAAWRARRCNAYGCYCFAFSLPTGGGNE